MLYAEVIPSRGGGTGFADMYSAFEAMPPEEQRRLAELRAIHNLDISRNRRHGDQLDQIRQHQPPANHQQMRRPGGLPLELFQILRVVHDEAQQKIDDRVDKAINDILGRIGDLQANGQADGHADDILFADKLNKTG